MRSVQQRVPTRSQLLVLRGGRWGASRGSMQQRGAPFDRMHRHLRLITTSSVGHSPGIRPPSASPSSALIPRSRVRSCACWKRCERTAQRGLNCSRATVAAAQLNSATPRLHLSDLSSRSRQALGSTSISSRNSRLPVFATKRVKLHCAARRRVRSESVQVCAVTQVAWSVALS